MSVLVKEEIAPAGNELEDTSWKNEEEEDRTPTETENRFLYPLELFLSSVFPMINAMNFLI